MVHEKLATGAAVSESENELRGLSGASLRRKRPTERPPSGSKGSKPKRQRRAVEDEEYDIEDGINKSIGRFDQQLLADYVAKKTKRFGQDLSLLELEEQRIPGI